MQLEIMVDRMKREFNVLANVGAPQVAYKETISKTAEAEGKYIKQSGGRGQYGHCWLKVKPQEEKGKGYEFVDVIGNPNEVASFRQRREGLADEFMQGRGAQVTYDSKTEFLTITGDATLKRLLNMQMLDQLKGWKIEYDDIQKLILLALKKIRDGKLGLEGTA